MKSSFTTKINLPLLTVPMSDYFRVVINIGDRSLMLPLGPRVKKCYPNSA